MPCEKESEVRSENDSEEEETYHPGGQAKRVIGQKAHQGAGHGGDHRGSDHEIICEKESDVRSEKESEEEEETYPCVPRRSRCS